MFPRHWHLNLLGRNRKSIVLAPIESTAKPFEIPLEKGGEAFWLDSRTVGHAVDEGEGKDKVKALYAISVRADAGVPSIQASSDSPVLIGKFPTSTASNFRFTGRSGYLIFSDEVYEDGDITKVKENDEAWENRGDTAYVYDETYSRHVCFRSIFPWNVIFIDHCFSGIPGLDQRGTHCFPSG